jgi:hypothetical protein
VLGCSCRLWWLSELPERPSQKWALTNAPPPTYTHTASLVALFFMTYLFFTELSYSMERVRLTLIWAPPHPTPRPAALYALYERPSSQSKVIHHHRRHANAPYPPQQYPQEIVDHMFVNSSRDGRMLFNFNITFPSVSCSLLSADAMDPLGNKQVGRCAHGTSRCLAIRVIHVGGGSRCWKAARTSS